MKEDGENEGRKATTTTVVDAKIREELWSFCYFFKPPFRVTMKLKTSLSPHVPFVPSISCFW